MPSSSVKGSPQGLPARIPINVSIDPGIRGTGVAFWDIAKWDDLVRPLMVFNIGSYAPMAQAGIDIARAIQRRAKEHNYTFAKVYCEFPGIWTSAGSFSSALSGDLFKLTYGVGCLAGRFNTEFIPVGVQAWKGQLSKEQVASRIQGSLGKVNYNSHEWDAVGIGLYAKGHF